MSSSGKSKAGSLKWAIDELSKQREDLDSKLKIALKRDETHALIDEVMAQRKALEQRISALEDGLKASSDLVDVPCDELESEMQKIDEKLDIAKERLHTLEQEEYLEELGKSLNRAYSEESSLDSIESNQADTSAIQDLGLTHLSSTPLSSSTEFAATEGASSSSTAHTIIKPMKASNRLPNPDAAKTTITTTLEKPATVSEQTVLSLEETALQLGIEPDFLAEKGINAILRMISRNGGKLSFPLEVDQIG
jgi:phage shock protein A